MSLRTLASVLQANAQPPSEKSGEEVGDRVQLGLSFLTRSLTLSCSSYDAPTPTLPPLDISLTLHTSDPGTHLQEGVC